MVCEPDECEPMPALMCSCGNRIVYGEIPCPSEWRVIEDIRLEEIAGKREEELESLMLSVLECSVCHRWWFFRDGFSAPPVEYVRVDAADP